MGCDTQPMSRATRRNRDGEAQGTVSATTQSAGGKCAGLIGLGNIGSFSAGLLARWRGLARLTLIDRDAYDESNLISQDIAATDVGTPKAVAQAERLRRINPSLEVAAVVDDVESVPLGLLRADVLVACLDSRRARQSVNQAAWRLGVPWVDAGVHADGSLARVNVYLPAADQPCLECAWDQRDYELVEQVYPCSGLSPTPAATRAPASLGALAAALQVLECQKLLAGQAERAAAGRQVLVDAASHRHFVTRFRRNPACRFDHATWSIEGLDLPPSRLSVGDALALGGAPACLPSAAELTTQSQPNALRLEGHAFVDKLTCAACGDTCSLSWRLSGRLGAARLCRRCQRPMVAAGIDAVDWLDVRRLPAPALASPLCELGFHAGDVVTVRAGNSERHFQLGPVRDESNTVPPRVALAPGRMETNHIAE
jgi:molybdopterin/thiamine biosynthesis adenylyltransferase